jgi:hypothetical protein
LRCGNCRGKRTANRFAFPRRVGVGGFTAIVAIRRTDAISLTVSGFGGGGFLLPTRIGEVFRWCLQNNLRLVHQMTLMTIGLYNEPAGAYMLRFYIERCDGFAPMTARARTSVGFGLDSPSHSYRRSISHCIAGSSFTIQLKHGHLQSGVAVNVVECNAGWPAATELQSHGCAGYRVQGD